MGMPVAYSISLGVLKYRQVQAQDVGKTVHNANRSAKVRNQEIRRLGDRPVGLGDKKTREKGVGGEQALAGGRYGLH
jgi:hypothetical protein